MHIPSRIIIHTLRFAIASASSHLLVPVIIPLLIYFVYRQLKNLHYASVTVMVERIMPIQQE